MSRHLQHLKASQDAGCNVTEEGVAQWIRAALEVKRGCGAAARLSHTGRVWNKQSRPGLSFPESPKSRLGKTHIGVLIFDLPHSSKGETPNLSEQEREDSAGNILGQQRRESIRGNTGVQLEIKTLKRRTDLMLLIIQSKA